MSSLPFECVQCWKEERIGEVINREAVSVDRAIFMATHAPFRSITYLKSPHQIKSTSEADLLNELLTCASKDQHAFVVVQGAPGTGKSHLIRWLKERYDAEMKQTGQKEQVLLIERAQNSLIGTLLQIIDSGLFNDQQMQDHRAKLTGATNTLSERALADNILDHLRVATYEVSLDASERPKKFITSRIERFLLDPMVREELKRSGGTVGWLFIQG
jgi:ABC-type ATPase with predicted acetyltransferase domain